MMKPLTTRQIRIVVFIAGYIGRTGWAPTFDEIRRGVGLRSRSTVFYQLDVLESRGYLTRGPKAARAPATRLRPSTLTVARGGSGTSTPRQRRAAWRSAPAGFTLAPDVTDSTTHANAGPPD